MVDMEGYAKELGDGVVAALPGWVERCVDRVHRRAIGPPPPDVLEAARRAGVVAAAEVGPRLRALLAEDIDRQTSTPLAIVRAAVRYPSEVLASAGVPPVERDAFDVASFPDDQYGLTPANLGELDPDLAEPSLRWGAAKAWLHKERHR